MKYFVSGATGFVGGQVVRQLREAGHKVNALVRSLEKAKDLEMLGVSIHEGDITEKESMRASMAGTDGVFHIAGWYKIGVRDKSHAYEINVKGTRNVLELMQELKIPNGVYTSTLAINSDTQGEVADENYHFEGKHLTVYDETKAEAHRISEVFIARGLPLVIVQPGQIYGPGDTSLLRPVLIQFLKGEFPLVPEGAAYAWSYIEDVARGHILAMEKGKPGEAYIICGPNHTVTEFLQTVSDLSSAPMPKLRVSPGMMKVMASFMGVVEKVIPLPEAYTYEGLRVMAGATYLGDNSKAKRELGYDPRPLQEGLKETLEHEMKLMGTKSAS